MDSGRPNVDAAMLRLVKSMQEGDRRLSSPVHICKKEFGARELAAHKPSCPKRNA